jgi:hypothetical protein
MNQSITQCPTVDTAVLFLIFKRLETTKEVFNVIREVRPSRLYIAADGANPDEVYEIEKVRGVREFVLSNIDWDCQVKTLFRDQNLGCKTAVSSAIDWFFDNEEMGIILEDDCKPSYSFFQFCSELLTKYRQNKKVWHIGGSNFFPGDIYNSSYYFSRYNHIWGWASWRDRWKLYSPEIRDLNRISSVIKKTIPGFGERNYWLRQAKKLHKNRLNSWDYQYTFSMWENNGIAILPCKNLISNIGFSDEATHTTQINHHSDQLPVYEIEFPLVHPDKVEINKEIDRFMSVHMFDDLHYQKIIRKLKERFYEMPIMQKS